MNENLQRVGRDEEGSALILALIIITVIGLLLAVVLDFTDTSLVSTPTFVANRDALNDVDGAIDGAINSIRGSRVMGSTASPLPCGPFNAPASSTPGQVAVTVTCQPQANSGTLADNEVPRFAINLLGPAGLTQTGNATLTVDGGVYSHGAVNLNSSGSANKRALLVHGDLLAEGVCTQVGSSTTSISSLGGVVRCSNTTPSFSGDPFGADPGYLPAVDDISGLAIDPVATCVSSSSFVAFSPGLYSDIPRAPTGCNGAVWWFQPGVYYFDFPDAASNWRPDLLSGKYVVGGTLQSGLSASTDSSVVTSPSSTRIGNVCDKKSANGVEFLLGGPSTLEINSLGYLELCGSVSSTSVSAAAVAQNKLNQIALYGLSSGSRTPVTGATQEQTGTPYSPYPPLLTTAPVPFLTPANAAKIDGTVSTASLVKATGPVVTDFASLRLCAEADSGPASGCFSSIPAGSTIKKVQLRVRHFESDRAVTPAVDLTLPAGRPALTDPSLSTIVPSAANGNCASVTSCVDVMDLTSQFTSRARAYSDLNKLSLTYTAKLGGGTNTANASFDGAELLVDYTPPGFEAARCPTSAACPILKSTVAQNLYFHGTVYVPTGTLDLVVHNNDTTIFDRGVIGRDMTVNVSASSKQTDSPFQLPRVNTTDRTVLFTGYVDGVAKTRALVSYRDYIYLDAAELPCDQTSPAPDCVSVAYPGFTVTVKKWSVLR